MKSLSLTIPRVLFLVGTPGAGKTYFAEKFSETFAAPFVHTEAIRHTMTPQPTYDTTEQKTVDALTDIMLSEMLKTGKTFLYEGGLEARATRIALAKRAREAGYEPMFIWVQTEAATAKQRAVKGVRGHNNILIPLERYEQLTHKFTAPNEAEKAVVISGKHTYASQAKIVLKRLAEARSEQQSESQLHIPERKQRKAGSITITQS